MTGRHGWQPDPRLITFGQYVKRARYMAHKTQNELAAAAGVDQPLISRLERALAPATKIDKVVRLSEALGRAFPFGYCPHEHWCQWQPAPPPPADPPIDNLSETMRELIRNSPVWRPDDSEPEP